MAQARLDDDVEFRGTARACSVWGKSTLAADLADVLETTNDPDAAPRSGLVDVDERELPVARRQAPDDATNLTAVVGHYLDAGATDILLASVARSVGRDHVVAHGVGRGFCPVG